MHAEADVFGARGLNNSDFVDHECMSTQAESISPDELVKRIVEAKAEEAWTILRDTILTPPRQTMLPTSEDR